MSKGKKKLKVGSIVVKARPAFSFGEYFDFFQFSDELILKNPFFGGVLPKDVYIRSVTQRQNLSYIFWDKKKRHLSASVHLTVDQIEALARAARKGRDKFKKERPQDGEPRFFKHFGNISFFFGPGAKKCS